MPISFLFACVLALAALGANAETAQQPVSPAPQSPALLTRMIQEQPEAAGELLIQAITASPAETMVFFEAALQAAPQLVSTLLTAAVSAAPAEYHAALYQRALAAGLNADEALLAAVAGGADPTLISEAAAAGGLTLSDAPAAPSMGSNGGGAASVSPN